jgi:hypothetical protein
VTSENASSRVVVGFGASKFSFYKTFHNFDPLAIEGRDGIIEPPTSTLLVDHDGMTPI